MMIENITNQNAWNDNDINIENSSKTPQNMYAWYLGKQYSVMINLISNAKEDMQVQESVVFQTNQSYIEITCTSISDISVLLQRFYTRETKRITQHYVKKYQKQIPKQPKMLSIKDSHAFWGQCTSKQEVIFHWRLSMVSEDAIEYVVIHELCHLMHMNHDRSFWRMVGKFCPRYEEIQNKLAWYQSRI